MPIDLPGRTPRGTRGYYNARAADQTAQLLRRWANNNQRPLMIYCEDVQLELTSLRIRLYSGLQFIREHPEQRDRHGNITVTGYPPDIVKLAHACTMRVRKHPKLGIVLIKSAADKDALADCATEMNNMTPNNITARNKFWDWVQQDHEPKTRAIFPGPYSGQDIAFWNEQAEKFKDHYLFGIAPDSVTVIYFPDMV